MFDPMMKQNFGFKNRTELLSLKIKFFKLRPPKRNTKGIIAHNVPLGNLNSDYHLCSVNS